jgi:hypothetical protein
MKCAKCGYDDNGTGDFAHVCEPGKIKLKPVMNEQIDILTHLAEQAGLHPEWYIDNPEIEKLAELIVRECRLTVSENFHECNTAVKMDKILKEHFGVE